MKTLGKIENRTENWATARVFARFFGTKALPFARRLAKPLDTTVEDAWLELFWKGLRDFIAVEKQQGKGDEYWKNRIESCYRTRYSNLRNEVISLGCFQGLQEHNYAMGDIDGLYNNLYNTEIDIVVQTDQCLFVGEAKVEAKLSARSNLVLAHQLIRQFVMANVLTDLCDSSRQVVPFVVGVDPNQQQVKFMIRQGWLKEENVLLWEDVKELEN